MPKKFLHVDEALALFQSLPSDEGSDASDNDSSDDDYCPPQSDTPQLFSDSSSDEDSDSAINIDMPGPSQSHEVSWQRKGIPRTDIPEFSEDFGPSDEILSLEDKSPTSLFMTIMTATFLESIVFQTNLYATQEGKNFVPVSLSELYKFIAINLLMGIKVSKL